MFRELCKIHRSNVAGRYNTQVEPMSAGTAGKIRMKKRSSGLSVDAEKSTAICRSARGVRTHSEYDSVKSSTLYESPETHL
jgi:hypothetical protein